MIRRVKFLPTLCLTSALALSACSKMPGLPDLDWDLRKTDSASTAEAARQATENRPQADARGVLSYPGYQVALARRDDTVGSVAARVGVDAVELARFNAVQVNDPLREGEVLALPTRVAAAPALAATAPQTGGGTTGAIIGAPVAAKPLDVSAIASTAIDKAAPAAPAPAPAVAAPKPTGGAEPARHKVARGETAFTIARSYNVSARALADWNGLGPDLAVREGQFLMIPVAKPGAPAPAADPVVTAPGAGSPTPEPPSAATPLPDQDEAAAKAGKPEGAPASPDLGEQRTPVSSAKLAFPADGKIIRPYTKGKNDGIDIGAAAGAQVRAAADGTVAAITKDTDQVPILVVRHADNLLTVYAGIDGISLKKGDAVKRGQAVAKVRASASPFLHFEVRKGFESTDPMPYLQ